MGRLRGVFFDMAYNPGRTITPLTEFRRWLIVASVLAPLSAIVLYVRLILLQTQHWIDLTSACIIWTAFYGGEALVQFNSLGRRCAWTACGLVTGACFMVDFSAWSFLLPGML